MLINNYIGIYKPNHHRSMSNGIVYEHILVAENIVGRPLENDEVVHHKDHCRTNNNPDNLMIFATNSDHARFHSREYEKLIKLNNGTYICTVKDDIYKCPICGKNKNKSSKLCTNCNKEKQAQNIPAKEELKHILLYRNLSKIGEIYNVTDNAIRKWCKKYNLPHSAKILKQLSDKDILEM